MNINITERIQSAGLPSQVSALLTTVYDLKYAQVHQVAAALDSLTKGEEAEVAADVKPIVEKITGLSQGDMLATIKFVSDMAEECGISLAAAPAGGAQASEEAAEPEEKSSFQVKVTNIDSMEKINAVKYLKDLLGVDLKGASALLAVGSVLSKTFNKAEADEVVDKLASFKVITEKI